MSENLPHLPNTIEECHDVIHQQHSEIQSLKRIVNELLKRVEKLERENQELRARLDSNSNNSSKPPSSDFKKNKKPKSSRGKSSGGQKGHRGHFRKLMDENEVDNIVICAEFNACEYCNGEIHTSDKYIRHQVHELPEIQLEVTEYQLNIGKCSCCARKQVAQLPQGVTLGITGPRLTSFMSMMVAKYQLSRRMLQEFLAEHFHFQVSIGTLFNKQRLVNAILKEPVDALLPIIKETVAVNMDETSHRQSGKNHWTWVIASKTAAYFKITQSRGKKILDELMDDFKYVAISDRYPVYNYFDSSKRQLCWAHLIRDFTRLWQYRDKVISRIGKELLDYCSKLFMHWYQFKEGKITRYDLIKETSTIVKAVGECLEQGSYTDPKLRISRFCKNLLERFSALWMFLEYDGVEPTNNHAERCLRYLVIWRKRYFSTQSDYGSEYVARTASLITTSKLQKKNAFQYLSQAISMHFSGLGIEPIISTA